MLIGRHKVSVLEAGGFRLDGGAMFGVVPKVLWERVCPSDEANRIEMVCRCLLIESNGRRILVDAGIGTKESRKFNEMYCVDYSRNSLEQSLNALGLSPGDITDVICSHLHFDHCGGSTRQCDGKTVPVFPNARHHVQQRQWDHALSLSERDRASYLPHNYLPLQAEGLVDLIDGEGELLPGIHVVLAEGHTPALQTVKVTDGSASLWFPSDLLPTSAHIPLPYIMAYDLQPLITLQEKRRLLSRAADEDWIVVYEHDPHFAATRLARAENGSVIRGARVAV